MLETGYLRYGGIVKPEDLNFSGLGACDACPRGLAFPSAALGVRAQIQHLYAYAAPGATPASLVRPLADVRFARVQPTGRAALWETMGNGNWATGPDYARKVLTLWRGMLTWSGVREPAPRPAGVAPVQTLLVAPDGAARLAGWRTRREPLAEGVRILGAPTSLTRGRGVCLVRWDALGAARVRGAEGVPPDQADPAAARQGGGGAEDADAVGEGLPAGAPAGEAGGAVRRDEQRLDGGDAGDAGRRLGDARRRRASRATGSGPCGRSPGRWPSCRCPSTPTGPRGPPAGRGRSGRRRGTGPGRWGSRPGRRMRRGAGSGPGRRGRRSGRPARGGSRRRRRGPRSSGPPASRSRRSGGSRSPASTGRTRCRRGRPGRRPRR